MVLFSLLGFSQRYLSKPHCSGVVEVGKGNPHYLSVTEHMLVFHPTLHYSNSLGIASRHIRICHILENIDLLNSFNCVAAAKQTVEFDSCWLDNIGHPQFSTHFLYLGRIANLVSKNVCRRPAHISELNLMFQVFPFEDCLFAQTRESFTNSTSPSSTLKMDIDGNKFGYHPSAFAVNHGISLPLNGLQRSQRSPDTQHADSDQRPICYESVNEALRQRITLPVIGTIRIWGGCWLNVRRGWWRWGLFSFLLVFLGGAIPRLERNNRQQPDNQTFSQCDNTVPLSRFMDETVKIGRRP